MVNAVQTWTPWLWPSFLLHPPVWYQHILLSTADTHAGRVPGSRRNPASMSLPAAGTSEQSLSVTGHRQEQK